VPPPWLCRACWEVGRQQGVVTAGLVLAKWTYAACEQAPAGKPCTNGPEAEPRMHCICAINYRGTLAVHPLSPGRYCTSRRWMIITAAPGKPLRKGKVNHSRICSNVAVLAGLQSSPGCRRPVRRPSRAPEARQQTFGSCCSRCMCASVGRASQVSVTFRKAAVRSAAAAAGA